MAEIMSGGYAVEYVCRVVDETDGKESVPASATEAVTGKTGKSAGLRGGGDKAKKNAETSTTSQALNAGLRVAMPIANALTDGIAGKAVGAGKQIIGFGKALAAGSIGGIIGAGSTLLAWGVSEIVDSVVSNYTQNKKRNDSLATSLDNTNYLRAMAGLNQIGYSRRGITGKITLEEYR